MVAFTYGPLQIPSQAAVRPFQRADLKFYGVDHSGSSYEARIFFNKPGADETTPLVAQEGYVGSFHIFGHGGCFGEEGHCDVPPGPVSAFDRRAPHQLTPTTKTVIVTPAVRQLAAGAAGNGTFTVTVVPVVRASPLARPEDAADVLKFDRLALLTYD
jgi:hypothetical protein